MFYFVLMLMLLFSSPASSGALTLLGAGKPPTGGGGGYQGPGDVVGGAKGWWGLRAYSAADRGNRLIKACYTTGGVNNGCADLSSDATTGNLVPGLVDGSHTCPGTNCTVQILYDRSGTLNCAAAACDATVAVVSNQPALTASCMGSLPCITWNTSIGSAALSPAAAFGTVAQPLTFSFIYNLTSSATSGSIIACLNGSVFATNDTTPTFNNFAGSNFTVAMSTGTWYANQSVFNNTSSVQYINGSSNSGTTGTNSCSAGDNVAIGWDSFNHTASAKTGEYGIWAGGFTPTQQSNMNSNQRTYWGF
jgi:hypothetical protein